jgi:hypothetical protein
MLFSTENIKCPSSQTQNKDYDFGVRNVKSNYINPDELNELEQLIQQNACIEFVTHGAWSSHQLFEKIINITGPAHICIATWAISQKPMEKLEKLKREGKILSLSGFLERKIPTHNAKTFGYAQVIFDEIFLTANHAKVMLFENEIWNISVISTANWTINRRTEVGEIFCNADSVQFQKKWMNGCKIRTS